MTTHQMNLQPKFYDYILHGTKRIELRLFDEKRQQIQIGDIIHFSESETNSFDAEVVALLHYKTFRDLFADFDISILADQSMTKAELLNTLSKFYTAEKQAQYGVIGIKIRLKQPVGILNYNPELATKFSTEKQRLMILLPSNITIEHVGSSAAKIGGKNIIDILIGVENTETMKQVRDILIQNGYFEGHDTHPDRIFLASSADETGAGDFHIHICLQDNEEYHNMITLRDFLLAHPEKAQEYFTKKIDFTRLAGGERREYKRLKSEYVTKLLAEALEE